jgi:uncharacterized protein (DUF2384 family)
MAVSVAQRSTTREILRAAHEGHVTTAQLALATGAAESTARRWVQGIRAPAGEHATRGLELASIIDRLVQVMDAEYIPVWLSKPTPRLEDRRPVDAMAAGDYREVSRLVASLEGMPVS